MRLLVDFLCRFGWGLSAGLVLTPTTLVPAGFFRVNLLVVLGLATFAALVAGQAVPGRGWLLPAVAAVVAWLGSVAWLAGRDRPGVASCLGCAGLLAAASWTLSAAGIGPAALVSGLVVGLTVHAMLLGHWYLNAPGMDVGALRRAIDAALVAWGVELAASLALAALAVAQGGQAVPGGATATALVALRWLAGLAGLPVLLVMARRTLEIPNTQSATGILYVACLAAILGELTSQLLLAA